MKFYTTIALASIAAMAVAIRQRNTGDEQFKNNRLYNELCDKIDALETALEAKITATGSRLDNLESQ